MKILGYLAPLALIGVVALAGAPLALGQASGTARPQQSEASPAQRLEVMRSRLEAMRRSLNNAIAATDAQDRGGKQKNAAADDARARLRGLEKEVSSVLSDVTDLREKIEKSERVESDAVDRLETSVSDLDTRVQAGMTATAGARQAATTSAVAPTGSPNKPASKKKFLHVIPRGGGNNKYEELTGTVAAGRDRVLFEDAAHEVRKGNYDTARLLFNTIVTTYPDSAYLSLAKLASADSFYLEGGTSSLIQAAAAYQDWLTFFPTDPLADRVMLKIAECEMRQMGLADRDVTRAKKAEQRLKVLLQQFPNTPLRPEAQTRLNEVQEVLGMHNLKIARFYDDRNNQGKGGLKGAQSRLREILEKYKNFSYTDEVLYRLGALYAQEEEPDEAAKYYQQVVRDWPNSDYAERAKDQLTIIGAKVPDPDPIKKNMVQPDRPSLTQRLTSEVLGTVNVTVDKNGVLISRDGKEDDLIAKAIANGGQLPATTPAAVDTRRVAPARYVAPQTAPATTGKPAPSPAASNGSTAPPNP